MYDQHNNLSFHVDTASPRSLIPMHLFPEFHNDSKSCDLYAVNNQPLVQAGEIHLTLQFDNFPDHMFTHSFILKDIANPILGLDFLHQNQHLLCLLWNISSQFSLIVKMILLHILHVHTILDTRVMYPHVFKMTMLCISVMLPVLLI